MEAGLPAMDTLHNEFIKIITEQVPKNILAEILRRKLTEAGVVLDDARMRSLASRLSDHLVAERDASEFDLTDEGLNDQEIKIAFEDSDIDELTVKSDRFLGELSSQLLSARVSDFV